MPRKKVRIIDIEEVRKNLEELIDELKSGDWFIIAVNGEPKAKVIAFTNEEKERLMREKRKGER